MADKTYQPKIYDRDGGNTQVFASGGVLATDAGIGGPLNQLRVRVTTAQVNAGFTLLAALPGYAYRIHDWTMIAIGGAASGATTVDLLGTQATASVKLGAAAVAGLTQSTVLRAGAANATVLADGASFAVCDANTAITANKTGSSLATSTAVDYLLTYSVEAQ
jgi:hypothetical protein